MRQISILAIIAIVSLNIQAQDMAFELPENAVKTNIIQIKDDGTLRARTVYFVDPLPSHMPLEIRIYGWEFYDTQGHPIRTKSVFSVRFKDEEGLRWINMVYEE